MGTSFQIHSGSSCSLITCSESLGLYYIKFHSYYHWPNCWSCELNFLALAEAATTNVLFTVGTTAEYIQTHTPAQHSQISCCSPETMLLNIDEVLMLVVFFFLQLLLLDLLGVFGLHKNSLHFISRFEKKKK